MITQAIKDWFRKMFAWWPWKQSTPLEYQHVASTVTSGPELETPFWTSKEGTVPQAGVTPRRFTLESRTERLAQPPHSTPAVFLKAGADTVGELEENSPDVPTTRQRLEFLRYLVQHEIVNEGFEKEQSDSSS